MRVSAMTVVFYKGTIRTRAGEPKDAVWASTEFGFMVWASSDEHARVVDTLEITAQEVVTELDLSGVDQSGVVTLVSNILIGGYLERPGVKGKGDAVLFLLVNEAIHSLFEIARKEGFPRECPLETI